MRAGRSRAAAGSSSTIPDGVDLALCERVTKHLTRPARGLRARGVLAGPGAAADQAGPLPPLPRPARAACGCASRGTATQLTGELVGAVRRGGHGGRRRRGSCRSRTPRSTAATCWRGAMTKEIVEAVGVLEREKGISADRLMAALEDALLSAYKKTPGAAKYARVEVDRGERRLPRVRADPAARPRGAAARRGRGGGSASRRSIRRRASWSTPSRRRSTRSAWPSTATRSTSAT